MSNRQITGRDTSTNFRFIDCKDRMWACYREGNRFVLDHSAMVDDHEVQRFLNMAEGLPLVEDSGVENRWYVGGRGRRRTWATEGLPGGEQCPTDSPKRFADA